MLWSNATKLTIRVSAKDRTIQIKAWVPEVYGYRHMLYYQALAYWDRPIHFKPQCSVSHDILSISRITLLIRISAWSIAFAYSYGICLIIDYNRFGGGAATPSEAPNSPIPTTIPYRVNRLILNLRVYEE